MSRPGTILVAVIVIAAMTAMLAAGLMFRMLAEVKASGAGQRSVQAYAAVMSGIQKAFTALKQPDLSVDIWYDNPELFRNQFVCDDGANCWYFTIYAPSATDQSQARYGLIDEAGKISINIADEQTLLSLPGMSHELVDCLLDYRDPDSDARTEGAEQNYYDQLRWPYLIKNAPLSTLEELLMVKGFNASVIFGEDANLNGILDANEDDGEASFPPDNGDGQLDMGLRRVAVTVATEPDVDNEGNPRANINGDLNALGDLSLPEETIEFIRLYRDEGNSFKHPCELLEMRYRLKKQPASSVRSGRGNSLGAGEWVESGVGAEQLAAVLDKLTAKSSGARTATLSGLVNVNTAVAEVLAALDGIDEDLARDIVDVRVGLDSRSKATTAWLYTQGLVNADTFKAIAPRLTARSFQFRIQCIGFGVPCGQYRIVEFVVDITTNPPRVTYQRDITRLAMPFALDSDQLQRGW